MVAKRSFPFAEYDQGLQSKLHVTEKVYNSTVDRMPKIYEQTLSKLTNGSKDFFRAQSQFFPGVKPGSSSIELPVKECTSCTRRASCKTCCFFCDAAVCDNCVRQCHICCSHFCQLCSIICYGPRSNTAICFSCK
ncbi:apoptosis regulatory protein Siva-like [Varroa jacobsoni]|uniref:apoptosis regulatory protein Siva-like n=1 Tax=Varroa jacobsoni TaxID=62625 RepID=UPI000BF6644D|nr:apoptosis regulatory protein Siva-like [Varroa jacobsoni]